MQGCGDGNMRGIIPRAMQQVGVYKNELEAKGKYSIVYILNVRAYVIL